MGIFVNNVMQKLIQNDAIIIRDFSLIINKTQTSGFRGPFQTHSGRRHLSGAGMDEKGQVVYPNQQKSTLAVCRPDLCVCHSYLVTRGTLASKVHHRFSLKEPNT